MVMIIACVAMLIFHRFKQPNILGYIVTGFLLGPHTPSLFGMGLKNPNTLETMSEMAIVLLMFTLGLEFSIRKLRQVGMPASVAATTEVVIMFGTGCTVGRIFGWNFMDCLFMGAILATSSTMVISKTLAELRLLKERFAGIIVGITVVEDIVCISLMAILASVAVTGTFAMSDVTGTFGKLGLFFVLVLVFGLLLVPRLMNYVERSGKSELILITSLGLCFGMALLAENLGYSTALGAFIIGALIAETHAIQKVEKLIHPIKDMFSAIFFVVVGTMIDPHAIAQYWLQITVLCVTVVIAKTGACALGALATGNSFPTSMKVGLGMSNVGEVSFIILALGMSLGVLDKELYPIGVSVSIITMLMTPFIFNKSDSIIRFCNRLIPKPIMVTIGVYINWYQRDGISQMDMSSRLARSFSIKNVVNLIIITAILIVAAVTNHWGIELLNHYEIKHPLVLNSIWLIAFVCCVPFLLMTHQNHAALSHLIVREKLPASMSHLQSRVEKTITWVGFFFLGVYVTILIGSLMPISQWPYIYVLAAIATLIGFFFRNRFERIYQRAEVEIETILTRKNSPSNALDLSEKNKGILANDTRLVSVKADAPAMSKSLHDIDIRNKTGATVISIERGEEMIVSPRGEEVLLKDDHLLLLGNTEQLNKAEHLINGEDAGPFDI